MRTPTRGASRTSFLFAVVLPRILGSLIPLFMYLESNGFRVDVGGLQARALSGALGFLLLYTPTGRRLAFVGWLFMLAIIVLNLVYIEYTWETVKLLLWWLAIGALWFVNWRDLIAQTVQHGTGRRPTRAVP